MKAVPTSSTPCHNSHSLDKRGFLALAFTLLVWSSAFAAIRLCMLSGAYSPGHLALLRFLVASCTMLIYCALFKARLPEKRDIPTFILLGFLGVAVYHTALNYGQVTVGAGAASFLISTAPVFTALLATFILKERLKLWGWLGIGLSMMGIFIIALGKTDHLEFDPNALLIVLSAFVASIHMIINKGILKRYSALESTTYSILCGTVFLLIFSPGLWHAVQHAPLNVTLAAIYIGVFPAALAYVSWAFVLSNLPASQTASYLYISPGLAILIAWGWLGEKPTVPTLLGGVLALLGVIVVNTLGKARQAPQLSTATESVT